MIMLLVGLIWKFPVIENDYRKGWVNIPEYRTRGRKPLVLELHPAPAGRDETPRWMTRGGSAPSTAPPVRDVKKL